METAIKGSVKKGEVTTMQVEMAKEAMEKEEVATMEMEKAKEKEKEKVVKEKVAKVA